MRERTTATPTSRPITSPIGGANRLWRVCSCSTSSRADDESCSACRGKLARSARSGAAAPAVPWSVADVLRSPGQPLTAPVRDRLEVAFAGVGEAATMSSSAASGPLTVGAADAPEEAAADRMAARALAVPASGGGARFDFSRIRLHADGRAAESAAAVDARAYTVGHHIVFGAGQLRPEDPSGLRLLAHEIAHTVQHDGARTVRRQKPPPASSSSAQGQAPKVTNMAGQPLSPADRAAIEKLVGKASASTAAPATGDLRFVLHDTASAEPGTKRKEDLVRQGHTALGQGYVATLPAKNPAVISSGTFFEARRPTVTEDEQGDDVMKQSVREPLLRQAWSAADAAAQTTALDTELSKSPDFLPSSQAAQFGKEKKAYRANTLTQLSGSGKIFAGGYWSVDNLCSLAAAKGIQAVIADAATPADTKAVTARRASFVDACKKLAPLFAKRNALIRSSAHVEIVEESGSDCVGGKKAKKLPHPYTATQYQEVEHLYLRAALEAGRFPTITTHYFVQQAAGNRCDPRCFDLGRLYQMIQKDLGHSSSTIYGLPTIYGATFKGESIWWDPTVCAGLGKTTI